MGTWPASQARPDVTARQVNANRTIHRRFVELVDLSNSLGDHLGLVAAIGTGDETVALDAFIEHIQGGFDLQMEAVADE